MEEELSVIEKMGFTEYFINVYNIINRAKELGILAGAARGCFLPGNKVSTLNLYGNKGINEDPMQVIEKIKIGQKVLTHDGKFHKVLNVLIYEVQDEDCIEIQLSNGHTIKCTADHRIFKKDVGFVEAKNLKKNDILNGAYRQKDIMDIQCDKCGKPLKRHFKKYRRSVLHNDIEITDIKHFKYTGKVYDLTVENTHNYTVGRVSVHNSAAGSEVCYPTDIVKIDPIKNHLMFERFLNPSRFNYPDIDMDLAVTPYPAILEQMSQKEGN